MEVNWYETSTAGKSYIEITEQELYDILDGGITDNEIREGKEISPLFRF